MLWLRCFLLWIALACALPATALATPSGIAQQSARSTLELSASERARLDGKRIVVGTKVDWAPIDLYTEEGRFRGLSGEYLELIQRRLGVSFEIRPYATLAESLEALKRGEVDIVPSLARTPAREVFVGYSEAYLDVPNVYVTRAGTQGVGPNEPMTGLRVAVERGYAVADFVREQHPRAILVEVPDTAAALRAVSEGQADVYLGGLPTTTALAERLLLSNLEARTPWHSTLSALHFGVRRDDTVLRELLDRALGAAARPAGAALGRREPERGRAATARGAARPACGL